MPVRSQVKIWCQSKYQLMLVNCSIDILLFPVQPQSKEVECTNEDNEREQATPVFRSHPICFDFPFSESETIRNVILLCSPETENFEKFLIKFSIFLDDFL